MDLITNPVFVLFFTFFVFLIMRVPIAIALSLSSLSTLLVDGNSALVMVQRLFSGTYSWILLAIPFFILAGAIMEKGGVTQRIVNFANALFGFLPGGLAVVNIVASMIFGGISGSAVADSSAIGTLLIPAMKRQKYSSAFSAAVTAASSPIGMIIPPSIPMVLWSLVSGVSLGTLFLGGVIPGIMVGLAEIVIAIIISIKRGYGASSSFSIVKVLKTGLDAILALFAPIIIIVGIVVGLFTPTEAAIIAVVYTLLISLFVYREMSWKDIPEVLVSSGKVTATVMFIVSSASVFSWVMSYNDIPQQISETIVSVINTPWQFMLVACLLLFVFGMFMDVSVIILLLGPILAPIVEQMSINPIQAAMIFLVVLATGLITPPVGLCLFVVSGISKDPMERVAVECLPFLLALCLIAILIWFFPQLVLWIPSLIL